MIEARSTGLLAAAMSHNYYSEIHLHVVWHTRDSSPLLVSDVEDFTHRFLKQRLVTIEGVYVHEIGGTENHVHLALDVSPTILISELVGQLKGACSHEVNQHFSRRGKVLQWQTGYGVVSFGAGDLPWVRSYIRNQRERHARGNTSPRLELSTQVSDPGSSRPPREGP